MKNLHLSKDLSVPIDICTEAIALIGARGSGKTHGAGKLVELLVGAGVPVVILDPVGVWYGLRLAKDGKGPGLKIPVFGGLHGDIPLEATAGAFIADTICDKNLSAVLDVSQFESDAQTARFVADFSERLFLRKKKDPSVIQFVLDEGQEFLPQNPQPGEQMMLHRLIRQIKIGRNFGMGVCIISPRPQEINKKALNGCQTVLAFRLTGAHERKAMKEWIAAHDLDQSVIEKLPTLETGNCHVWSPAFLKVNKEIRILPKETFDASATPKFGQHRAARTLAPIDLEQLRESMKATIEKAKADDPKALRTRIAELERAAKSHTIKIAGMSVSTPSQPPKIERVEVPVLKDAQIKRLEVTVCRAEEMNKKTLAALLEVSSLLAASRKSAPPYIPTPRVPIPVVRPPLRVSAMAVPSDISRPQQKILNALAQLQAWGINFPDKRQVALFADQSPSSSGYTNNLSALKTAGLISYPQPGAAALTEEGYKRGSPSATASEGAMREAFLAKIPRPQARILRVLIDKYPESIGKDPLAELADQSPTSSGYTNNLSALKSLGVLDYPDRGLARAADILFIGSPR